MEQVFESGSWISVCDHGKWLKPLSKISFSFKVQVLTWNIENVREKSNSCIFHLPRVGQASLVIPSPGEWPRRQKGRERRSCEQERGRASPQPTLDWGPQRASFLPLFSPLPILERIKRVLLEMLLGITVSVSKQGGNYTSRELYRGKSSYWFFSLNLQYDGWAFRKTQWNALSAPLFFLVSYSLFICLMKMRYDCRFPRTRSKQRLG